MIITVESNNTVEKEPEKKKSGLTGNLCYDRTQRSTHRAINTSQLESRPLRVPYVPDGGNDMILFNRLVVYSPYLFLYYEDHIHFHTY